MPSTTSPNGMIEHDGMLWTPKRGATATADEFIAARATFREVLEVSRWNPWVRDDRAGEYERAVEIMDQWRRADPGYRNLTMKQIEARWARQDREREKVRAKIQKEREARKSRYDEERAESRLALLEQQSLVPHETAELAEYLDETLFPKMDGTRRREKVDQLKVLIERRKREIDRLTPIVGDPETVIDQNGWLPQERREAMLLHYRFERERRVRHLRAEIPELAATVERKDRWKVDSLRRELDSLLAVPPLTAADMCPDCPTPLGEHGWRSLTGPCVAWPGPRARLRQAREILAAGIREAETRPPDRPQPKPQPLAIIPSGLPIAEITKRLQELQTQFPEAEVRRGRANRWELWPKVPAT